MNPTDSILDTISAASDTATSQPLTNEREDELLSVLLKDQVKNELTSVEKQTQYLRMRETDFYYRGIQDLVVVNNGVSIDFEPLTDETVQQDDWRVNVIRAYGRKFVPAIGTRPWHNAKAAPEDPTNEVDRKAARLTEALILWFKQIWNIRTLSLKIPYHQYKDGTVFLNLSYVADAAIFGTSKVEKTQQVEQEMNPDRWVCGQCGETSTDLQQDPLDGMVTCPACGGLIGAEGFRKRETAMVPQIIGYETYPNAGPSIRAFTGYEVTIPFFTRDLSKAPFLILEYKEHRSELYRVFGDALRTKMENARGYDGDSALGDHYRDSKSSPSGTPASTQPQAHWKYRAIWLQPWMFELIEDKQARGEIKAKYPNGVKISEVEEKIIRKEPASLDADWVAIPPETTEFVCGDPYAYSLLELQELINMFWTVAVAFSQRKLPAVVTDPNLGIADKIKSSTSGMMEVLEAAAPFGRSINDGIGIVPTPQGEVAQFGGMIGQCKEFIELVSGLNPTIFGQGDKQATAEAARNALNQALAMLAPNGEYLSHGCAELYRKAIAKILENATQNFHISVKQQTGERIREMVDLDALGEGRVLIEPEPGVPMSWAERRSQLMEIITQNPQLAQAMGVDLPVNLPIVRDYTLSGMNELRVPQEDAREKVLGVIQQLLEQQPIGTLDQVDAPSILPEPFVDSPDMAGIVKAWCISPAGVVAKEKNQAGYRNVVLYGQALEMLGATLPPANGVPSPAPGGPPQAEASPLPPSAPPGAQLPPPPPPGPQPGVPEQPTGEPAAVPALQ